MWQLVSPLYWMHGVTGNINNHMPKSKYTPCIKVCTMDDQGYCLGCQRTAEEVSTWRNRTEEQQLAGIEMLRDRRIWRVNDTREHTSWQYHICMVWRVFHHIIHMAREVSSRDDMRFALCGKITPVYPIISHIYPIIKKLKINMNQWGLKPAMYRPCFPTHRNIKKIRKKWKKCLTGPWR